MVIVTGWHKKYSDGLEYYGEAPGSLQGRGRVAGGEEAQDGRRGHARTSTIHSATSMAPHRGGPQMKRLAGEYKAATGKDYTVEHGEWNVAHKILLGAGIPTIEQVGGDVDQVKGKRATSPPSRGSSSTATRAR